MNTLVSQRWTKKGGFTLIELLLVLLISSVIVLGINAAYRQAHLIWASCEDPRPIYHDARLITETLRREFACLYFPPRPDANEPNADEPFQPISIGTDAFAFYTLAPSWKAGLPASYIARVRYRLTQDPVTGEKMLERFEQPCAGEKFIAKETSDIVARGLSEFDVSVSGGDGQVNEGNGKSDDEGDGGKEEGAPPNVVKVSLKWAATGNVPDVGFETTILVPSEAPLTP
jgi:prepilin-type N-terminal cleavage/methylation domain-containing protein